MTSPRVGGRVGFVLAVAIAAVIGVVAPGGAVDKKGQVTEFSAGITAGAFPRAITAGPDGNVWFTEYRGGRIARITPTGEVTEFSVNSGDRLNGITTGPDGNLWFTQQGADRSGDGIGRITPTGVVTMFSAGLAPALDGQDLTSSLFGITAGPDGNLWFTEASANRIGRITPTGVITEFSAGITKGPDSITAGPDGNLWFTEASIQNQETGEVTPGGIGRITPRGVVTELSANLTGGPDSITAGCDGNLWFVEPVDDMIGRITPKGKITEFSAGLTSSGLIEIKGVTAMTAGPDGNLWFTKGGFASDSAADQVSPGGIGRITPTGEVTEFYAGITPDAYLEGITAGPDGNLWFTGSTFHTGNGRIGRITPGPSTKPRGRHDPTLPAACPRRSPKRSKTRPT
jgi:streptogramin lyase